MTYSERLRMYEAEKRAIQSQILTSKEYEKKIREIAKKWNI